MGDSVRCLCKKTHAYLLPDISFNSMNPARFATSRSRVVVYLCDSAGTRQLTWSEHCPNFTHLSRSSCFGPMMYTALAPLAIKVVVIMSPMPW